MEEENLDKNNIENIDNNVNKEKENIDVANENIDNISVENVIDEEKKDTKKSKIKGIIFHIIAIICIAMFCVASTPKTLQNDTYYTITIGEYIYNNGVSDLTTDLYSNQDLPYTYPHWLYDLGMYIIYNNFGFDGIYVSTMVFFAILGISVYALCNKKSKNKVVSFAITILSMYIVKTYVAARAQLITFILFVLAVIFIEKFLETKKKRYAILLILIPLLIANLHCAVFPFYFILFLPYIGEYLCTIIADLDIDLLILRDIWQIKKNFSRTEEKKNYNGERVDKLNFFIAERKRKRKILRENPYKIKVEKNHTVLLLILIIAIAACTGILNPAGDGAYTYLYKTMQGNTTSSINEHLPLTLVESEEFAIVLCVCIAILIFTDTKIKLSDLFMFVGITALAFESRRQVSMFALFCIPIMAKMIADMVNKYDRETFEKLEKFVSGWFGAIVVICLAIIINVNIIKDHLRADIVDSSSYPVQASDWILSNLDVENIKLYNEYNYGSYLLFRGIPVFIDSRCDLYTPEFNGEYNEETKRYDGRDIFSDALNIASLSTNYKTKFEEYGVTHAILYSNSKLAMVLESDSDYKLIYDEGNFKIFERLVSETETVTAEEVNN